MDHDTKKEMGLHYMYVLISIKNLHSNVFGRCFLAVHSINVLYPELKLGVFRISGMTGSFGWNSSMTFVVNLRS